MKFALLFIAVALVASAQASPAVETRALEIPQAVQVAVRDFKGFVEAAKKKAVEIHGNVRDLVQELIEKSSDKIKEIWEKIEDRLSGLYKKFGRIDFSHCSPIVQTLKAIGEAAFEQMKGCFDDSFDIAKEVMYNIVDKTGEIEFDSFAANIRACMDNSDKPEWTTRGSISCFKNSVVTAYVGFADSISFVTSEVIKLAQLAGSVASGQLSAMPACMAKRGYYTFVEKSDQLMNDGEYCLKENYKGMIAE